MPGPHSPEAPYQLARSAEWLNRWLTLMPTLKVAELAKLLSKDPNDHNRAPRSAVNGYLGGTRLADEDRAFRFGEIFGTLRTSSQPYVDGVVALHAFGYYERVIVLLAMMLEEKRWRDYAQAAVATLWTCNSFLDYDVVDTRRITVQERTLAAAAARIKNFSDELRAIWEESGDFDEPGLFSAALLFTGKAEHPTYRAALIAWSALNEIAAQQILEEAKDSDEWFPGFFQSYLDMAHEAMTSPSNTTPKRKERDAS